MFVCAPSHPSAQRNPARRNQNQRNANKPQESHPLAGMTLVTIHPVAARRPTNAARAVAAGLLGNRKRLARAPWTTPAPYGRGHRSAGRVRPSRRRPVCNVHRCTSPGWSVSRFYLIRRIGPGPRRQCPACPRTSDAIGAPPADPLRHGLGLHADRLPHQGHRLPRLRTGTLRPLAQDPFHVVGVPGQLSPPLARVPKMAVDLVQ